MSQYTPNERAEIVAFYIENNRSIVKIVKVEKWPPRSPDLTVPDFILWGYLKRKFSASKPKTIDELKCNIRAEIAAIMPEILANIMQNARKRAAFCVSNGGGHLIDVVL